MACSMWQRSELTPYVRYDAECWTLTHLWARTGVEYEARGDSTGRADCPHEWFYWLCRSNPSDSATGRRRAAHTALLEWYGYVEQYHRAWPQHEEALVVARLLLPEDTATVVALTVLSVRSCGGRRVLTPEAP
jgi:hypothetical protein